MFGRIGNGSEKDELFPVQLNFGNPNPNGTQDTVKIVGIAAGAYHSLALAGYPIHKLFTYNFNFHSKNNVKRICMSYNDTNINACLVPCSQTKLA